MKTDRPPPRLARFWVSAGLLFASSFASAQTAPASTTPESNEDEVVTLSPFEVTAETNGYFQANTMSGTRLNSKIEDLGQSITVMTKEQMSDFAMLDINDVFDYMAGTEGTHTYSDLVVDRTGAVTDNISLNPNNANRVRGIGNANIGFNNIPTTGRVPVDPLWLDSIELSRGPNANIFGLGNSSGTVNQVPATANLTRDFLRTQLRGDSDEGWRASLDVNRVVIDKKLSVRASYAYQHTGFQRKPSGEDARRLSFQVKAQPFKSTTVAVSWFNYKNAAQRPNFTTPRDNITSWIAAGRPSWDPVTRLITLNGVTYGQNPLASRELLAGSTTPIVQAMPSYFNASPTEGRSLFRVGTDGEDPYWSIPNVTNATTPAANGVANNIRFVSSAAVNSYGAAQPLFATYAALTDKSIYDYENISLMSGNKAWDDVDIYLAQLDQIFLNSPMQTLAGQVTFMREDTKRIENLPLGPASVNGVIGEIYGDPNIRNLDGSPNPYYGRPYLRSKEPFLRSRPMIWDTVRAQLAYKLDFSQNANWTKWIGTHQLLGYYEYKDQQSRHYAWRRTTASFDHQWQKDLQAAGIPPANRTNSGNNYPASANFMRNYEFYYVGETPGGVVEHGPNDFPNGSTVPFVWGNTGSFHSDPAKIDWTPSPDGSGGNASRQRIIKTRGGVLQSFFLDGKVVTTFGLRTDQVFDRNAPPVVLSPDLLGFDYRLSDRWNATWRPAEGDTKMASVVVRPFRDFGFVKNALNNRTGLSRLFAEAVSGLSLTYNRSDNFIPEGPAIDLFERDLPNQTGSTKEYGLWLTLLDNRLSIRYNHFETDQINLRSGDISTMAQRVLRADGIVATDRHNLEDRSRQWITQLNPGWSAEQVQAEVLRTLGISQETFSTLEAANQSGTLAAIQDIQAKGDELEVNFNPTPHWTVSASATKTESINKNAGSTVEDWINLRMPIWESVEDPRFTAADDPTGTIPTGATGHLLWRYIAGPQFTAYGYDGTNSAYANYTTFVEGPLAVYRQLEGRPRPQMAKYSAKFSTKFQLEAISDNRFLRNMSVGGSLRWDDKRAIGFLGVQSLPAKITQLDPNKPVFTPAETYVDLFVAYRTRFFNDKVRATFQLNVRNVGESGGRLQMTSVLPDGSPLAWRIIDPRQFILSANFEL